MIDLSRDLQSITRMRSNDAGFSEAINYGVSSALGKLTPDDKTRVKVLQMFDDEVSRVFFAEDVIVVEGDSEVVALRGTVSLLREDIQKSILSRFQIVKARGKGTIISLVRYLKSLDIVPKVMHDGDFGTDGAEVMNAPIKDALGHDERLIVLDKCLENVLGYEPSTAEKPYKAYKAVKGWETYADVPKAWQLVMSRLFGVSEE